MPRSCIQCGECLRSCPVFRVHGGEEYGPRSKRLLLEPLLRGSGSASCHPQPASDGRQQAASAGSGQSFTGCNSSPASPNWTQVASLARLCAGCGRCRDACPRSLSAADLLAEVRSLNPDRYALLWQLWIRHCGPLWPTLARLASLWPDALTPSVLEASLASMRALMPAPESNRIPVRPGRLGANPGSVAIFAGCTARHVRPGWISTATDLLRSWGYEVLPSSFACCGMTLGHAGLNDAMVRCQTDLVIEWQRLDRPRLAVFCASCRHGLDQAAAALPDEERERFHSSVMPLSRLLEGARTDPAQALPSAMGYHSPCHARPHDPDFGWLADLIPGLVPGKEPCCGMGGILKLTDPSVSAAMADRCRHGFPAGVNQLLTGCSGCAMHLDGSHITARHWLDVIRPAH